MKPIGYINSCYPDKFGTPRQPGLVPGARASLKISAEWQPEQALQGLERFSHLWVIFIFHANTNQRYHAKVHPPRLGGDSLGVFATRSPHRPNPIGLSLVELEKIQGDTVYLKGSDLISGTPVLDIKPYLPEVEAKPSARHGWAQQLDNNKSIVVQYSEQILNIIEQWSDRLQLSDLQETIEQTLSLDPRPLVYRGFEGKGDSPYRRVHAVRLYDGDIHFEFISQTEVEIKEIRF